MEKKLVVKKGDVFISKGFYSFDPALVWVISNKKETGIKGVILDGFGRHEELKRWCGEGHCWTYSDDGVFEVICNLSVNFNEEDLLEPLKDGCMPGRYIKSGGGAKCSCKTVTKVYCKNCKSFRAYEDSFCFHRYLCLDKSNIKKYNTFKSKEECFIQTPKEKNENNDCGWYIRKFWKFWVKD